MIRTILLTASAMIALSSPSSAATAAYCDAIGTVGKTIMSLRQSGSTYDEAVSEMTASFGANPDTLKIALGIVDEAYKDVYPVRADESGQTMMINGFGAAMRSLCMGN